MNRAYTLILASAFALATPAVWAENLLDILELAKRNDAQLQAAQAQYRAEREALPAATAALLPSVSLFGSWNKQVTEYTKNDFGFTGTVKPSAYNLGLTLRQPLFRLDAWAGRDAAKAQVARAEAALKEAEQDLLLRVAEAYFQVLSRTDDLELARAEKNAIARQLEQAKQRYDVGLIAVTDVHEAQARYDLAVAQEIAAENALANAREALRVLTGQSHEHLLRLREDSPLVPPTPNDIEAWVKAAQENSLTLQKARLALESARARIRQKKAARYPTLDFSASYQYDNRQNMFGAFDQELTTSAIGIELNAPLYQGGAVSAGTRQARAQAEASRHQLEASEREVLRRTREAYLGVLAGMSHVKALRQALASSESALRATEAGFEVGTRTAVEVLDAQRELYRARRDYARARYDYLLNTLRLKQAVSALTEEDLTQINQWLR